jgi:hypothetical protein
MCFDAFVDTLHMLASIPISSSPNSSYKIWKLAHLLSTVIHEFETDFSYHLYDVILFLKL